MIPSRFTFDDPPRDARQRFAGIDAMQCRNDNVEHLEEGVAVVEAAVAEDIAKRRHSRPWLIEEIAAWLRDPGASRYFFLTGEPG